jgi:sugar/nucleoside kinase (ribokinase family)
MDRKKTIYDVATIGNYTKDTIITPDGTRQVDGGGVRYAAHAAASLGFKVAAITRLAAADSHVLDALEAAGIDVYACETPESTHMCLDYPTGDVDKRILTVASTAGSFTPFQIRGVDAKAFVVSASIRGEVSLEVIRELRSKDDTTISLDVQGFIRVAAPDGRLEHREWWEKRDVLSQVDILKADAVEARFLTGETDIETSARMLADLGPSEIIISHSDGLLVHADGEFHRAPFHAGSLAGRSGRGDTCVGSYVARRLTSPPAEATVWAAAVASLKMEHEGPFSGTTDDVVDLLEKKYGVVHCT